MTPTLSQIAADVRRLAEEYYPTGLAAIECVDGGVPADAKTNVARLALIGAMVMACEAKRCIAKWSVRKMPLGDVAFLDRYHGNDPLLSLRAAFLWAKGGTE